jgi:hypothetical protein
MTTSIIFSVDEIGKVDFDEVIQTPQTLTYSIDKTRTYVSWEGQQTPSFVSTITTAEGPLTQSELLQNLERPDWLIIPDLDA